MTGSTPLATASPTTPLPRLGMSSSRSPPRALPASGKPTPNAACTVFSTSRGPAGEQRCDGSAVACAQTAPGPSTCPERRGATAPPSAAATPSRLPRPSPPHPDCWPRPGSPPRNSPSSSSALGHNRPMDLHLTGKVVLITGGTDGLGAALADRLVEEGARVAVCGRDPDRLAATEQRLRDAGGDALVVQADVTNLADLERFVDAAIARWGRLDGLVNNAGKSAAGRIDQVSDDEWIADLNLKVLAAARCIRLAVPHLIASGGGAIVNVLNMGAKAPGAASLPTTASRAAGLAITKAASKDLGGHGIRVNALLIGLVESAQWQRRAAAAGQSEEELYRQMVENADIPLGRVGRPEEFADLAAYLLSDRSSYVTGSAINLDGGTSPVL